MSGAYPVYHVAPENDLRDHNTSSSEWCWCKPRIEREPTRYGIVTIVVHNSLDGREKVETGEAKKH